MCAAPHADWPSLFERGDAREGTSQESKFGGMVSKDVASLPSGPEDEENGDANRNIKPECCLGHVGERLVPSMSFRKLLLRRLDFSHTSHNVGFRRVPESDSLSTLLSLVMIRLEFNRLWLSRTSKIVARVPSVIKEQVRRAIAAV